MASLSKFVTALDLFLAGTVAFFFWRRHTLTVFLKSKREFDRFDPDQYLQTLSQSAVAEVREALEAKRKKAVVVRWRYSTPARRKHYSAQRVYSREVVETLLERLEALQQAGEEKVLTLNGTYDEWLSRGGEVADGVPKIYCYSIPSSAAHGGLVKVGYAKGNAHRRIADQFKTAAHLQGAFSYEVHFILPALTITDEVFMDHAVHRVLKARGVDNPMGEWFRCRPEEARRAVEQVQFHRG